MADRDLPDSSPDPSARGPLARLRAHIAAPRGMRRIDALLSNDDAEAAIAALAPLEVYELVHDVGFEDASDLIALATPEQIQGCLDLDAWSGDELDLVAIRPWLAALCEAGYEKLGQVWAALDAELRALILQREVKVYDTTLEEEPPDTSELPILPTHDRFFQLELLGDEDSQRLVTQVVEDLYRADADLARHTLMAARSEPPAELEETSYRWRAGRLADLGYIDFYDALDLFRPLAASDVKIGENTQDTQPVHDDAAPLPVTIAEEVVGRGFLTRVLAAMRDDGDGERLENAVLVLVNRVLAAGRAKPGQTEVIRRGALYATATLSLGLEIISAGDVGRAAQGLRSVGLHRLFRVGYTVTQRVARAARALASRAATAGSPARELVAGLCSPRPLFARAADVPPQPGLRPFESQADLRRAGEVLAALTVRIALVEGLGVDVVAMASLPEPRAELDDHVRTALARAVIDAATWSGAALSQAELTALRRRGFDAGKLTASVRAAGHAAVQARLDGDHLIASKVVLDRLVDGWLDDLERILGGVTDAEVDPRFVEGVLVDVHRS